MTNGWLTLRENLVDGDMKHVVASLWRVTSEMGGTNAEGTVNVGFQMFALLVMMHVVEMGKRLDMIPESEYRSIMANMDKAESSLERWLEEQGVVQNGQPKS